MSRKLLGFPQAHTEIWSPAYITMVGNAFCNCISAGNFNTNKSVAKTVCGRIHLEYGHGRHAPVFTAINWKPHKVVLCYYCSQGELQLQMKNKGWKNKVIVAVTFVMKSQQPTKQMIMSRHNSNSHFECNLRIRLLHPSWRSCPPKTKTVMVIIRGRSFHNYPVYGFPSGAGMGVPKLHSPSNPCPPIYINYIVEERRRRLSPESEQQDVNYWYTMA